MRQLKLIAAAVMALAAISATASTAYGAQAGGFLPTTNFIGSGPEGGKLETLAGSSIACKATTITKGTMETDSHGAVTISYTGCKALGAFAANSKGDVAETILAASSWLLCLINPKTLEFGIWVEPSAPVIVEVKAAGAKLAVTGGTIGTIVENKKSLKKTLSFKATKGDSEPKNCTGMDGKIKTVNQTTELNENKKPESSGLTGKGTIEAENKTTTVEIMDGI